MHHSLHRLIGSSFVALAMIGCGTTPAVQAPTAEHLRTDNDRYFAAYEEAFSAYEYEVTSASRQVFGTRDEAAAVEASHTTRRFDGLFETALRRRGLSVRGFTVHRLHHPELSIHIGAVYGARHLHLRRAAHDLHARVDPARARIAAFDTPSDGRIASR